MKKRVSQYVNDNTIYRICFSVLAFIIIIITFSCSKDKGNYSYKDINLITVSATKTNAATGKPDSLWLKQSDTLSMELTLTQTQTSNDLSYSWYLTQTSSSAVNPKQFILGTTTVLKAVVNVLPGNYQLVCKITDNNDNVSAFKYYKLTVGAAPWGGQGWLVLQDQSATKNGNDISLIGTLDGSIHGDVYHNLYSITNGHKLPMGTNLINVADYVSAINTQKISFIYGNGGVEVNFFNYADTAYINNLFLITPSVINIQANFCRSQGLYEMLVNNGILYFRIVSAGTIKTPPIYYGAPVVGSWYANPNILTVDGSSDKSMTIYDDANKCFLEYYAAANYLCPSSRADIPNQHFVAYSGGAANLLPTAKGFDMNNIRQTLLFADNAQRLQFTAAPLTTQLYWNCFFRNSQKDSTFIYQIPAINAVTGYTNNFTSGRYYLDKNKCPGINTANLFAVPTHLTVPGGGFYYTNANQIYFCPLSAAAAQGASTASLGYAFATGTIIKVMKVLKTTFLTAPANEGKVLVVATDETANGNGNNVYYFNLSSTGTIVTPYVDKYTGFDKIVDIAFKKYVGQ